MPPDTRYSPLREDPSNAGEARDGAREYMMELHIVDDNDARFFGRRKSGPCERLAYSQSMQPSGDTLNAGLTRHDRLLTIDVEVSSLLSGQTKSELGWDRHEWKPAK